jgi:hypothetical protein
MIIFDNFDSKEFGLERKIYELRRLFSLTTVLLLLAIRKILDKCQD